jgi:competence protein ComEC
MEEALTSRRSVVAAVLIAIVFIIVSSVPSIKSLINNHFNIESETIIVFCDVGQGDATYIRLKNKIDILIDAGPDRKVLQCLGKYMPFFDKTIELAFITHPQKDHYGGFEHILDRYEINYLILNPLNNKAISYQNLLKKLALKKVNLKSLYSEDVIRLIDNKITFYWPTKDYLYKSIYKTEKLKSGFEVNYSLLNLNKLSYVFKFEVKEKSILFTGDIDKEISNKISDMLDQTDIFKVPHHGSKNGATKKFIDKVNPKISIITVGKNNSYGHPHQEILDLLKGINTQIRRTDKDGEIVIRL